MFTLKNKNGIEVSFIEAGGKITGIKVPNAAGEAVDVVLGYDTEPQAIAGDAYFGALCGRFSNRIVKGKFSLNGVDYQLDCNDHQNHLHGGMEGFNKRNWTVEPINSDRFAQAYRLSLVSPDGDQNYPGELSVTVIYGLTEDNEFVIEYEAGTTKDTIINLTSHAYFNLKGAGNGNVTEHELTLNAEKYTPLSGEIGTVNGTILPVKDTPMDFTQTKSIAEAVTMSQDEQIALVDGMDHNFVINNYNGSLKLAATLVEKTGGRKLEVFTDQPGIQVYTGNHFDGTEIGKGAKPFEKWGGVALETQIFPDSPNNDNFPNAVLKVGDTYKHTCIYKFTAL